MDASRRAALHTAHGNNNLRRNIAKALWETLTKNSDLRPILLGNEVLVRDVAVVVAEVMEQVDAIMSEMAVTQYNAKVSHHGDVLVTITAAVEDMDDRCDYCKEHGIENCRHEGM